MAAKRNQKSDVKRSEGHILQTRSFYMPPVSVNTETNSFSMIVSTSTPVRKWIDDPSGKTDEYNCPILIQVDEVLPADAVDYSRVRGMPLLDSHDAWTSVRAVLGRIDAIGPRDVPEVGNCLVADTTISPLHADLMPAIAGGFLGNVSVGYVVTRYAPLVPQPNGVPLAVAESWQPLEVSLVAIGADPNAYVRSAFGRSAFGRPDAPTRFRAVESDATNPNSKTENTMTLEEALQAANDAVAASELAVAELVTTAGDADAAELTDDVKKRISALCGKVGADDPYAEAKADSADAATDTAQESTKAADEAEVRTLSKSARSLGLGNLVDDLRSVGNGVPEIRSAVREALVKRSSAVETSPAPKAQPEKRSVDPYASYNKR